MKYLNIILTVLAVLLLSITFKLINLSALFNISNQNNQATVNLNQELINSNHRLEKSFSNLAQEVKKINNQFLLKERKGAADAE